MKTDIKILIAMHKEYRVPKEKIYLPIQVGKEIHNMDLHIQGDNSGENISVKNKNYCELTALYWAWKNLKADYIGLVHYRRYFSKGKQKDKWKRILSEQQLKELLKKSDIILPKKRNYFIETNESQYLHAHHKEGWEAMCRIIGQKYPNYVPALNKMRTSTKGHRFNMFVMKQEYFNSYCEWLFDILFQVEEEIDISEYTPSEARVFGYLSERMLDVWIETNKCSYAEIPVCFMEKQNWWKKGTAFVERKIKHKR